MQYAYIHDLHFSLFIQAKGQTSCYWWIPKDLLILVCIEDIGQTYAYTTYILYIGYVKLIILYIQSNHLYIYIFRQ
jgi:hypothetical protein